MIIIVFLLNYQTVKIKFHEDPYLLINLFTMADVALSRPPSQGTPTCSVARHCLVRVSPPWGPHWVSGNR